MSEFINNQTLERQVKLKDLIKKIHQGMPLEEAKVLFKKDFQEISTDEIVKLEQALMDEGMSMDEVQSLCDVHAAVFDGSITDIHKPKSMMKIPGHPAKVFSDENHRILQLIEEEIQAYLGKTDPNSFLMLRIGFERLMEISKHYERKENLFFPALEKKGITSIPKVMWGVDDEIRADLKEVKSLLDDKSSNYQVIEKKILNVLERVKDMVMKEENILLPKLSDIMTFYDWIMADKASDEIGYFLEKPKESWAVKEVKQEEEDTVQGEIKFDAGHLSQIELNSILNTLPLDMTFVDKDGHVKYFTQGKERIFNRPVTIIGRHVSLCHPPKSVHIVEDIIESFRTGKKDHEDFYIQIKNMFVYIRYFAVRDKLGQYLGTLEITQDIKPIRDLEGEKRLVNES
ncbi:DUF438 domain-containing protein [Hujiaoplasma nucleasis]|uniref:DUF438 domain-containing protein n=1 Tax=Hujiaoplasma nucleasis TaxID=2725268 RepID=A0A7L6N222_9MOLU|nr:DUF438 domain-containing protein [Hujiaoplasma nucleasis]QLY39482.1 DUF438 domain-containing protein [Hujiaoplasma nucleasis]